MTRKILSAVFAAALAVGMLGCTAITAEAPTASEEAAATATPTAAEEIAATETPVAATTYKTAFITRKLFSEQQAYAWKQFQQYCGDYGFTMDVFEG